MSLAGDARETGRAATQTVKVALAERLAGLIRRDEDLAKTAIEVGLIDRAWLEEPGRVPVGTAGALDVVERFLERSAEQRPSLLARVGLSAIQALSWRSDEPGEGTPVAMTVVFTDLEGFTRFTSRSGDEAASALLSEHQRAIGPVVRSRGGRVVKRIGDGLMLSFHEAAAAIHCAVELLDAAPEPLRLRAGVHSGELVATRDDLVGHVVNVAARVTEAAKGDQVLVTGAAVAAAGELRGITVGRGRRRTFKGVGEPVVVHRAERVQR
jgi:adenylate cyclase